VLQEQVSFCYSRDSQAAKTVIDAFAEVQKKHNNKLSVLSQSIKLLDEHLLPMMMVRDAASGVIVSQVYNFQDIMGGIANLKARGKNQ
jgi:ribosomal protein S7